MIEIFLELLQGGAYDEWNEQWPAVIILLLVLDFGVRVIGRARFRAALTKVAKLWIGHKEERALRRGDSSDSSDSSKVRINPHPHLGVLLEELIEEFNVYRKETDGNFRDMRKELDKGLRSCRLDVREDLDREIESLRRRISKSEND